MRIENAKTALVRKNEFASWSKAHDRLTPATWAALQPSFTLKQGARVYTMGSCFARNIEEHLSLIGCRIPTLDFVVPKSEWSGLRSNGILNKYTPAAIYNDIAWAEAIFARDGGYEDSDADIFRFDIDDDNVIDLQLAGYISVSIKRFYERRQQVYHLICEAFRADCVTLTLGMIEAWRMGDIYVQQPPANRQMLCHAAKFEFVVLDQQTISHMIQETIALIRKHNPDVKVLITTSPVPMGRTFTQDDVIIANMTSKATLRAVAADIADSHHDVDYFPSFEAVMMSPREIAFGTDLLHVRDGFVGKIVENLIYYYFTANDKLSELLQLSRIELDAGNACNMEILLHTKKLIPDLLHLSERQVTTFLRICWRLRDKKTAVQVGYDLMRRSTRTHDTLRAVAHIFPKIGLQEEARIYATDMQTLDPENSLALRLLE